ncbi:MULTISPECIES: M16 family metallopeptidase [Reichenbachiella]|uniref:Predicted Zn-dependent peptidase n=1 Tax=Reichenbachiella agariperforans TaxID=156994 RepID=A0A1M6JV99_REIAG|nr:MULTISPECIES: pitrilysin family protein [Reichenbachiella]RJE74699.1 zinc protease [Reichenbachiella sp. MSK19-1]SHJ50603.1 Predicted Zn-dependent peptidase [Reichenbachiella agariperforans]
MDYELIELPNKIRIVHKQVPHTKVSHCAIMLDIGSRDEKEGQQGIAHFWEHMAFKGTKKRKAYHIINRLESLGGELNAYTTKEKICFYATILDKHLDKSVELLSDITFNSIFPETQVEKERQVILEEMSMYLDDPEDAIQDQLDSLVFKGHTLGDNILGTKESVRRFQSQDFHSFLDENMDTSRIVLSSMGSYSMADLLKSVTKYLEPVPEVTRERTRVVVNGYNAQQLSEKRDITQAHIALGSRAFDIHSKNRVPFFVLNNILGGQSMTSKLNLSLREKYGLVYHAESNFMTFSDTGLFSLFYATEPRKVKKSLDIVKREFDRLKNETLGVRQLQVAKDQIKGQLAISEENNQHYMLMMAKSILNFNKIESLESVFAKVDQVTADQMRDLAQDMLNIEEMCELIYIPNK